MAILYGSKKSVRFQAAQLGRARPVPVGQRSTSWLEASETAPASRGWPSVSSRARLVARSARWNPVKASVHGRFMSVFEFAVAVYIESEALQDIAIHLNAVVLGRPCQSQP